MQSQSQSRSKLPFGVSWEKVVIWGLFGGVVYSLRHFFAIVFLTFIMTYLAERLVGATTRTLTGGRQRHWIRKPVIVVLYTAALMMIYVSGQYVLPRAIDQGKWLLVQVQTIDLERIREQVLASTLGRVELARFKRSDGYEPALAAYVHEKSALPEHGELIESAQRFRKAFREQLVQQEGRRALEELKQAGGFTEAYRQWLQENRVERELVARPELRQRLEADFDASWRRIYDEESFERERGTPTFLELREAKVLRVAADELVSEARYRDEAEAQLSQRLGEERVRRLAPAETERRFQEFFVSEVPRRWGSFPFSYEKLVELERVTDEAEYRRRVGAEATDEKALQEAFDRWTELRLAKEHPWAELYGDTSQLVRENMPRITGWLTSAINNTISFGLNLLLALTFSLMIVWEIPLMRSAFERVPGTRAEPFYREIAPGLQRLGTVIGTAFSAQILIALLNSAFTFISLSVLGLPSSVFLSLVVFFFSLVPYVGVIIGSVPIVIVGLQEGGLELGLYASLCMFVIHELEAWVLSPKILGDFLHLNPIVVILVLFAGQELFGVWGLLLAVPVTVFLINDVLLRPARSPLGPLVASAVPAGADAPVREAAAQSVPRS
jgi:predicted PurR-regulated permease PerM